MEVISLSILSFIQSFCLFIHMLATIWISFVLDDDADVLTNDINVPSTAILIFYDDSFYILFYVDLYDSFYVFHEKNHPWTFFQSSLYNRKDFEDENNRRIIFTQLNQDLRSLEDDGLTLPGDTVPTYFTISTLCADNLAGCFSNKILD